MVVVVSVNYHNALPVVADFKCPFQSKNLSRSISPNNFSIQKHTASLFTPIKTVHHRGLVVKGENGGSNSEPNKAQDEEVDNLGVKAALSVLKFYKREISPLLLNSCRYVPTCSEYSMEAYKRYGFVKGTILTTWRLCRCNPIGGSGFDPPRWFGETRRLPEE